MASRFEGSLEERGNLEGGRCRLFLFLDGTSNEFKAEESNVLKTYQLLTVNE